MIGVIEWVVDGTSTNTYAPYIKKDGRNIMFMENGKPLSFKTKKEARTYANEYLIQEKKKREVDPLLKEAVEITIENKCGSVPILQRKLSISYKQAERLISEMEVLGVVGSKDGTKPRKLLIKSIGDIL